MLTAEAANKQMSQFLLSDEEDKSFARIYNTVSRLPSQLKTIACGLFYRDENGDELPFEDWSERQKLRDQLVSPLEDLSKARFSRLCSSLCGPLSEEVIETWDFLKASPYQSGYYRKCFGAPNIPEATLEARTEFLANIAEGISKFQLDVLTPEWLATWGGFQHEFRQDHLSKLLAVVINRGDETADAVFEILCQTVRNEHAIAGVSRMTVSALLKANRPDGWDLIENTLIAAQRQEGLRQVILESVDEAHPEAFRRMLHIIRDQKLARFSAVVRAVDVWFGLEYESKQLKSVNSAIDRCVQFLETSSARKRAISSDDPEDVYFALWSLASKDVDTAIEECHHTSRHSSAAVRYVTAKLLNSLRLPQATGILTSMLSDEDLQVAFEALEGLGDTSHPSLLNEASFRFEQIEQLYHRLGTKPRDLPAIVWDWNAKTVDHKSVAEYLVAHLGDLPPTRLVDYLPALSSYRKACVVEALAKQKKWNTLTRDTLFELTGSTSPDVRSAAMNALSHVTLTDDEILSIEHLFARKASDLRVGALKLLLAQSDDAALSSAARMLASKKPLVRLGGWELMRRLMDDDRCVEECINRAKAFSRQGVKLTDEETTQLRAIVEMPSERVSLDDALGLMDPKDLSPVPKLSPKPIPVFTQATVAILKSLDELVHEHRDESITYTSWDGTETIELLGAAHGLPVPDWDKPPKSQRQAFPLRQVWEKWLRDRPDSMRDPDGFEMIRAAKYIDTVCDYWWDDVLEWAAANDEGKQWIESITNGQPRVTLKYERTVESIVQWMNFLHRPGHVEDFLLDSAESFMASVPQILHDDLVTIAETGRFRHFYRTNSSATDWREQYGTQGFHKIPDYLYKNETSARFKRRWKLLRFLDQPIAGAPRKRPDIVTTIKAYKQGLNTRADIADALLGPRPVAGYDRSFQEINWVSRRSDSEELDDLLNQVPDVWELFVRARERVLEIELARGDTPTPATVAATSLRYSGVQTLGRILRAIGDKGFKVTNRYSEDARQARLPTLTAMAKLTFPAPSDTQEDFHREIKSCIQSGLNKQTVLELMFLGPQWAKFVEEYFHWDGLSEGLYWFLAHMRYINADTESAATSGGYESEEVEEGEDDRQRRSAWDRLVAERTHLTEEERACGAIDVDWFHKVYQQLTPKRWEALAAAARFAANPAQAKRARYQGEVLLGKASRKDLFSQVRDKKLRDSVRLIGLYPLAKGARSRSDLKQRYDLLVGYRQYAKGLSNLTKPEAMTALEIGFRNLASTAGFIDPLRLEWAMEADAGKDLQEGSISVSQAGVTVSLELDVVSRPVITTIKNGKTLKNVPPSVKKVKQVSELLERVPELRKQASRVKESLENAMCRGDEFEPDELVSLCDHALIKGMLSRLVLIADDKAGYPDEGGTTLRDHSGTRHKVKRNSKIRIAHPYDLKNFGDWAKWQKECFDASRVQPFKQVFRELYVVTKQELKDGTKSYRYAGQQVSRQQACALWNARNWHTEYDDVFKAFPGENLTATIGFQYGGGTPLEVEGLTCDDISFVRRDEYRPVRLSQVPGRIFSEVMRDIDLVTSVAHQGDVDPEATASTIEMRTVLIQETCQLLGYKNVKIKPPRVVIKGQLAEYAVHLGSGNVHLMPGGAICIVPVHAQHRGRLFLPFADDDPRTAEILSKVVLLADDGSIQDPSILEQLTC